VVNTEWPSGRAATPENPALPLFALTRQSLLPQAGNGGQTTPCGWLVALFLQGGGCEVAPLIVPIPLACALACCTARAPQARWTFRPSASIGLAHWTFCLLHIHLTVYIPTADVRLPSATEAIIHATVRRALIRTPLYLVAFSAPSDLGAIRFGTLVVADQGPPQ
jgi:hypothetical protein